MYQEQQYCKNHRHK